MTTRFVVAVSLLAAAMVLVAIGPDWPERTTALICGDTPNPAPGAMTERARFKAGMDVCADAMARADAAGSHCFCSVVLNPYAAAYYTVMVVGLIVAAAWVAARRFARGMTVVLAIVIGILEIPGAIVWRMYTAGVRIPNLLAGVAIIWTQFVFFGPQLAWRLPPGGGVVRGMVLPHNWSHLLTLAFWVFVGLLFGAATSRLRSVLAIVLLACVCVAGISTGVYLAAPLFDWQVLIVTP